MYLLFSRYYAHIVADLIKKLELRLMIVLVFLKIKFRHAQISVS